MIVFQLLIQTSKAIQTNTPDTVYIFYLIPKRNFFRMSFPLYHKRATKLLTAINKISIPIQLINRIPIIPAPDKLMLLVRKKIRYNSYSHHIPLLLHSAFLHQIQDNTDSFFNSSILLLCTLGIFLSLILQKALKIHYEKHNTFSPNNKV